MPDLLALYLISSFRKRFISFPVFLYKSFRDRHDIFCLSYRFMIDFTVILNCIVHMRNIKLQLEQLGNLQAFFRCTYLSSCDVQRYK